MKVLFVYKFLTVGGVETVLRARIAHLADRGVEAHCWFFADYGGSALFRDVPDRVHVGTPEQAVKLIVRGGFDVVSTIDTEEILPVLAALPEPPPVVVEAHSAYLENLDYLLRLPRGLVKLLLVPTRGHGDLIADRLRGDWSIRVVPNPVADSFLLPLPVNEIWSASPQVAWIGRLDDHKNWRGFLELAARATRDGLDAEYVIVGHPVEPRSSQDLQEAATAAGMLGRLRWLCALPHARVPALLDDVRASGGVLVVTSRGESFGMTVVEAMARGCAVVLPAAAPYDETTTLGTSSLGYAPGSTAAAASVVRRVLADAELRSAVGEAARVQVLERYSAAATLGALVNALHEAAGS